MTVPNTFATAAAGNVPASQLDANFAAVLPLTAGASFPLTGRLYAQNLSSTTGAAIPLTYAYTSILAAIDYDIVAASVTLPEQTVSFRMTSSTGGGTTATYKSAFGAETIANAGSSPAWAGTVALTTNAGYALAKSQIAFEVDHNNNSGFNAPDGDVGTGAVPIGMFYVTGAGSNQVNFGIGVSGNAMIRNGLVFFSGGPVYTSIRDYSSSQILFLDTGTHSTGIDGTGATYSGNFIAGPGSFTVNGYGAVSTLASSTSRAGLRLPHGAAPTSPTNGDMWTTTAGLYVRINGATVGPLT